ncbi:hypothetical protein COE51_20410 [Bacillus pseudomycoides]|nr:hypothetical protein COE51_20410 [Bacillus pseudomycoides]
MIEYKGGKEYWNGRECDGNFVFRTLADMFPQDYERYMKESIEFKISHTVLSCPNCFYKCVLDDTNVSTVECPSCKIIVDKSGL